MGEVRAGDGLMDVYPVTIIRSRYQGAYEGAKWVAFNAHLDEVEDAEGSDVLCAYFFDRYTDPIGRGESPKHAYDDLVRQLNERDLV